MSIPKRFDQRIALVTGGANGIGRAVVERLVREAGRAIVWDVDSAGLSACEKAYGDSVHCQVVDVSVPSEVEAALQTARSAIGVPDILVNNAGIVGPSGPFWMTSPDQWDEVLQTNLRSVFLVSRAVCRPMLEKEWGRVVNVASVTANEGPKNLAAYAASKAAVVGLTKSMGKDLAGTGVLVNAVTPALIATDMLKKLTPEYFAAAMGRIPLNRPGTLEEASALITWLCSEECSFSTGAVYDLSGGRGV